MVSTTRTVAFPGLWDQAAADYGGGTAQAFADLSYRFAFQGLSAEIASGHAAGIEALAPGP